MAEDRDYFVATTFGPNIVAGFNPRSFYCIR